MKIGTALCALALSTGVASAQDDAETPAVVVSIVEPDENGYIGQIIHHNRLSYGTPAETFPEFQTERGLFILRLITTPNSDCDELCPDTVELWDWPENIIPDALDVTTPERGVSIIRLYLFQGV